MENKLIEINYFMEKLIEQVNEISRIGLEDNIENRSIKILRLSKGILNTSCLIKDIINELEDEKLKETKIGILESFTRTCLANSMIFVVSSYEFSEEDNKFIWSDLN